MSDQSPSSATLQAAAVQADPAFDTELSELLIEALNLDVSMDEIDFDEPLYDGSLGLDSIDILEIALTVSKKYGLELRADDDDNRQIFASMRSLAAHVQAHRTS